MEGSGGRREEVRVDAGVGGGELRKVEVSWKMFGWTWVLVEESGGRHEDVRVDVGAGGGKWREALRS